MKFDAKIGETEMEKKILFAINEDWLALHREDAMEPAMPIVDPHHHLWDRGSRYLLDELKRDIDASGHDIRATVFLQCDSMYRAGGDPKFAPIGETEFVNGIAAMSASGVYGAARFCAGIVGFADLFLGAEVDAVLEAHLRTAGDRFKGVRYCAVWDADKSIKSTPMELPQGVLLDSKFRAGFARLSRYGLSFDSLNYHTQLPELTDLARTFPDTVIVLNHIGLPLGIGVYAGRRDEFLPTGSATFVTWPNVRTCASSLAAWVCTCSALSLKSSRCRRRRRSLRTHGSPLSRLASKRSAPNARCSKAISRSTSAITATA